MRGLFITGTDTGAGKTFVASALVRALRRQGVRVVPMKPVASGCQQTEAEAFSEDARQLIEAAETVAPPHLISPYRFLPSIAPHIAAAQAGVRIEIVPILEAFRQLASYGDVAIVEGVGGLRVPLNECDEVVDLIAALGLPVVVVVALRLGCLNHALLTAESLIRRGLPFAGWVANHVDPDMAAQEANLDFLREHISAPLLARIPFAPDADPTRAAECFDPALLMPLLGRTAVPRHRAQTQT